MRSQIHELQALSHDVAACDRDAETNCISNNIAEETLVTDARSVLRPADFVEHKYQRALRDSLANDPASK